VARRQHRRARRHRDGDRGHLTKLGERRVDASPARDEDAVALTSARAAAMCPSAASSLDRGRPEANAGKMKALLPCPIVVRPACSTGANGLPCR
jgi:hypothetical protein